MPIDPQQPYVADLRDLERVVNAMTFKVPVLDRNHKSKARAKGMWLWSH